jgi:hypothetical protein
MVPCGNFTSRKPEAIGAHAQYQIGIDDSEAS